MTHTSSNGHFNDKTTVNERTQLLKRLKGQTVIIPDIRTLFSDYPGVYSNNVNPNLQALSEVVEKRLSRLYHNNAPKLKKLKAANFALFTALWWPKASFERLCILAYMIIWLFTWDDEVDEPTGACADDFEAAQAYREETEAFVKDRLGLDGEGAGTVQPLNFIVESFREVGDAFREAYTVPQRGRFFEEIQRFMRMSQREQEIRLEQHVPTLDEYWTFRLGSSAVYIGVAAAEYATGSQLPASIMGSTGMQALWKETNLVISITNDLLSLQKELKLGCIDSVVPLACMGGTKLPQSVDDAVCMLARSKRRLDQAADALVAQTLERGDDAVQGVADFVDVSRSNCVGNLMWR